MPRHNGKVERYNRILAEGLLYAIGDQPPASRLHAGVTNVGSANTRAGRGRQLHPHTRRSEREFLASEPEPARPRGSRPSKLRV